MKTIRFKSTPENFRKEYLGLKPNTVRKRDEDLRFEVLNSFVNGGFTLINIEIENSHTGEIFTRRITDVTNFEGFYIISWKNEVLK